MEFATGKLRCPNPAWTPFSGAAGPAGRRPQKPHEFLPRKNSKLKIRMEADFQQRKG
jgi:hypothetical protein